MSLKNTARKTSRGVENMWIRVKSGLIPLLLAVH